MNGEFLGTVESRAAFALRGLREAWQRFSKVSGDPANEEAAMIALVEALWWTVSLDEEYGKAFGPLYKTERDADERGRVIDGIRLARNRGGHQRALLVEKRELTWPIRWPATFGLFFRWRPVEDLPPADPRYEAREKPLRTAYEMWLSGRPADQTVREVLAWFDYAAGRYLGTFVEDA